MDDLERLALQAATNFVLSESGRILRTNAPDSASAPRVRLAWCSLGSVLRFRHDVGGETARTIAGLLAREPGTVDLESTPAHLDECLTLLATEAPVERCEPGFTWAFPARLDYPHPATLVRSDTADGDRLLARLAADGMPRALVELGFVDTGEFWPPWCVALDGNEVASIAFAARLSSAAAETGVATVSAFRSRGFAAAATAGWASHPALRGRALFYSASHANVSSQQVASRLGLRPLAATMAIT